MLSLSAVGQVAFFVENLPRARDFYRNVLDLSFLFESQGMVFFQIGALRFMLGPLNGRSPGSNSLVYFNVANIHASHHLLSERGVRILRAPGKIADLGDSELWMCEFADPEGNILALQSTVKRTS